MGSLCLRIVWTACVLWHSCEQKLLWTEASRMWDRDCLLQSFIQGILSKKTKTTIVMRFVAYIATSALLGKFKMWTLLPLIGSRRKTFQIIHWICSVELSLSFPLLRRTSLRNWKHTKPAVTLFSFTVIDLVSLLYLPWKTWWYKWYQVMHSWSTDKTLGTERLHNMDANVFRAAIKLVYWRSLHQCMHVKHFTSTDVLMHSEFINSSSIAFF